MNNQLVSEKLHVNIVTNGRLCKGCPGKRYLNERTQTGYFHYCFEYETKLEQNSNGRAIRYPDCMNMYPLGRGVQLCK